MDDEVKTEEIAQEGIYEDADTRADIIAECHNALECLDMIDASLISKKAVQQIKNIRRRSLDILDYYIKEIHDEIFEEDDED